MGELENWRVRDAAAWVRKTGLKVKRLLIGDGVARRKALVVVVVRVRRGVDDVVGRRTSVRRARRASGEIN